MFMWVLIDKDYVFKVFWTLNINMKKESVLAPPPPSERYVTTLLLHQIPEVALSKISANFCFLSDEM